MGRVVDASAYEELEAAVARALVAEIRSALEQAGLSGTALQSTVASVASSVADIYDGAAHVEGGEDYVSPILGFAIGRMRNRLLLPEEGGSSIHEFVPGAVRAEFESGGA
jgi:hypothetical protein